MATLQISISILTHLFYYLTTKCNSRLKLTNINDKRKLNVLSEQILNIYNDFFIVKTNNSVKKVKTTNSHLDTNTPRNNSPSHYTEECSKNSAVESASLNLTTFPALAGSNKTSSYHSSTLSLPIKYQMIV